jgi:GTP-binding protein
MTFRVAICGRPNVGKSTLFNRLAGKMLALVDDQPGVTRDRREAEGSIADLLFTIVDTAGLEDSSAGLEGAMRRQTETAVADADVVLFLIDARAGVTPLDKHFADWLRRQPVPALLLANKCEGKAGIPGLGEAYALGLGDPIPVSAAHGEGLDGLYDALAAHAPADAFDTYDDDDADSGLAAIDEDGDAAVFDDDATQPLHVAIVGRPNVGKSTLVNRLLGQDRMLTGPQAGVTRDAVSTHFTWKGREVRLVDTAGMRRLARVEDRVERLAFNDAKRAVKYAQIVVLVLDATVGIDKQDLTIAHHVIDEGRGLIVCMNKWDTIDDRARALRALNDRLTSSLTQVRGLPVVTLSALDGKGVDGLLPACAKLFRIWSARVPTAALNRWLDAALAAHPPPLSKGRRIKIRYLTQAKTRPPTFAVFGTQVKALPESYVRYLANDLRDAFGLDGTPIRMLLRQSKNPYAPR